MKTLRSRSGLYRAGSALVITLSMLVMLSVAVLAFMTLVRYEQQSGGVATSSTQADSLARGMGNIVLGDLVSEIVAGSVDNGTNGYAAYLPLTNSNAIPQRILANSSMLTQSNFNRLYKQSVPAAFYSFNSSNGVQRASSIGTWISSKNGRVLSTNRWNAPQFIIGGFTSTNQLPNWIYVTRTGTNGGSLTPTTWSADMADSSKDQYVIGRVAYNVYELGGAMDVNVAGDPGAFTKPQLLSSLAGAKLTDIPGIGSASTLVNWRNKSTSSDFLLYATNTGPQAGFLTRPSGDRRFVGRQDLIAYVKNDSSGGISTNALPYLTHYSRGIDRPSAVASASPGKLYSAYLGRPLATKVNPYPSSIRYTSKVDLKDGTSLRSGDPVAFRKFPLQRLAMITSAATSAVTDDNPIYRYFGLSRSSAANAWTYGHGDPTRILTLAEVKDKQREPDFFEMLQAAVVTGSLGVSAGAYSNSYGMNVQGLDENIYRQILQIGASLIDQYDADDYPTEIQLKDSGGNAISAFGIENLPYLNEIMSMPYRPAAGSRTEIRAYLQFEVWNPHQNAKNANGSLQLRVAVNKGKAALTLYNTSYSTGGEQGEFDVLYNAPVASAYGISPTKTNDKTPSPQLVAFMAAYPQMTFTRGGTKVGPGIDMEANPGYLEFSNSSQLQEPFLLGVAGSPGSETTPAYLFPAGGGSTSPTSIVDETMPAAMALPPVLPPYTRQVEKLDLSTRIQFAGIMVDQFDAPDDRADGYPDQMSFGSPAPVCYNAARLSVPSPTDKNALTVELQIYTPDGWRPYQRVQNILQLGTANVHGYYENIGSLPSNQASNISFIRPRMTPMPAAYAVPQINLCVGSNSITAIDPRTSRFGFLLDDGVTPDKTIRTSTAVNDGSTQTNLKIAGAGWSTPTSAGIGKFFALAANINNQGGGQQYYCDPDQILRRADGNEDPSVAETDRVFPLLNGRQADRPLILNRPFTSVGEMSYAFRDVPWKTLDFRSPESGDGALLDYFTLEATDLNANNQPVKAGVINVNTASEEVLQSVLERTLQQEKTTSGLPISTNDAKTLSKALAAALRASPLMSIRDLPQLGDNDVFASSNLKVLRKTEREAFVRALAPVTEVNVWNVLVDVIAQSGRIPPGSTGLADFVVQGESRYWVSAAIDRTTGEIVDVQYELVTE